MEWGGFDGHSICFLKQLRWVRLLYYYVYLLYLKSLLPLLLKTWIYCSNSCLIWDRWKDEKRKGRSYNWINLVVRGASNKDEGRL